MCCLGFPLYTKVNFTLLIGFLVSPSKRLRWKLTSLDALFSASEEGCCGCCSISSCFLGSGVPFAANGAETFISEAMILYGCT